jgi:hypothetical protein
MPAGEIFLNGVPEWSVTSQSRARMPVKFDHREMFESRLLKSQSLTSGAGTDFD